jgi:PspC domain
VGTLVAMTAAPPLHRPARPPSVGATGAGIDPLLWRIGFVALGLAGGACAIGYLLLWLFLPTVLAGPGTWSIGSEVRGILLSLLHRL